MKRFTVEIADEAWIEIELQIRYIALDRQAPAKSRLFCPSSIFAVGLTIGRPTTGPLART